MERIIFFVKCGYFSKCIKYFSFSFVYINRKPYVPNFLNLSDMKINQHNPYKVFINRFDVAIKRIRNFKKSMEEALEMFLYACTLTGTMR